MEVLEIKSAVGCGCGSVCCVFKQLSVPLPINWHWLKRITMGFESFMERYHLIAPDSTAADLEEEFWDFIVLDADADAAGTSASIFYATQKICQEKEQFLFDRWLADNKSCDDGIEYLHQSRTSNEALVYIVTELTQLPESIGTLSTITGLDFNCNLIECLPQTFGFLTQLTRLNLRDNQLSELPSSFGKLVSLQRLNLCENQITKLPSSFSDLKSLSRLNIAINKLTALPPSFPNLANLEWLELEQNELVALPHDFGRLDKLVYFNW